MVADILCFDVSIKYNDPLMRQIALPRAKYSADGPNTSFPTVPCQVLPVVTFNTHCYSSLGTTLYPAILFLGLHTAVLVHHRPAVAALSFFKGGYSLRQVMCVRGLGIVAW